MASAPSCVEGLKPGYYRTMSMRTVWILPNRYQDLRPLGNGAFGCVISALDTKLQRRVAVKKLTRAFDISELAKRSYRELRILKHMKHENIIGLLDVFTSAQSLDNFKDLYLVSQLMERDLSDVVRDHKSSGKIVPDSTIKLVVYQLFRALKYFHAAGIIHRDMKTKNIAVNADVMLRVLDFGLACPKRDTKQTDYVVTRWYRAPEVILKWCPYGTQADVWSVGCIMAELLTGQVLFLGGNELEQLDHILDFLGSPTEEFLQVKIKSEHARNYLLRLPKRPKRDLRVFFAGANPLAIDLLEKLLVLDPDHRISAVKALEHEYLEDYHDPLDEPEAPAFDASYEDKDTTTDEWKRMTFDEINTFVPPHPSELFFD